MQRYILSPLFVAFLLFLSSCAGTRPDNLGYTNGKFIDCPKSPNCVWSQTSEGKAAIDPISFKGNLQVAQQKLIQLIESDFKATMVKHEGPYIQYEFKAMMFVDDVEFYFDEKRRLIHFRSASRKGHSDMGANRRRMEKIREGME